MDDMQVMAVRNLDREIERALSSVEMISEDIANLPVEHLADMGARIKRLADTIDFARKNINKRIIENAVDGELRGAHHCAKIVESIRNTFDSKAARAEYGEEWYKARCKQSETVSVRFAV